MRVSRPAFPGLFNALVHYCCRLGLIRTARFVASVWAAYFVLRVFLRQRFCVPEPAVVRRARVSLDPSPSVGYARLVGADTALARPPSLQGGCLPASAAGQAGEGCRRCPRER